jgi:hypothetical protein
MRAGLGAEYEGFLPEILDDPGREIVTEEAQHLIAITRCGPRSSSLGFEPVIGDEAEDIHKLKMPAWVDDRATFRPIRRKQHCQTIRVVGKRFDHVGDRSQCLLNLLGFE